MNSADQHQSGKALYGKLRGHRDTYLQRAWDAAELTIPSVLPRTGHSGSTVLYTPWQGIGARGVNNLASKLLLTLYPTNTSFFRLKIDDFALDALAGNGARAAVETALGKVERAVLTETEARSQRPVMFSALKQLVVTGNVLLHITPENTVRAFRLDQYVVQRDEAGNVLTIVLEEKIALEALPAEIRNAIEMDESERKGREDKCLYTVIARNETGSFDVHQEYESMVIESTRGSYPADKLPWVAVRWTSIQNEHYGRGYVEEYLGDLTSLENLTASIVKASAAAARVVFLVAPGAATRKEAISSADSGDVITGSAAEVSCLQMDKYSDFRVALETMTRIEERLSRAFLLNSSIQRSGERVTAEEIRYMAQELETALGGIYSVLAQELQLPHMQIMLANMQRSQKLPVLPKDAVAPTIVTGLDALSRGKEGATLRAYLAELGSLFGPDAILRYVNVSDAMARLATSYQIDSAGLMKSAEQIAEEDAAAQQAQAAQSMIDKGTGPAINAAAAAANQQQ